MAAQTHLKRSDWRVETCELAECRRLVEAYHYAGGGSNTATYRHGLYRNEDSALMGCAWWIPPTKGAALATYAGDWRRVLSLSRLVCAPEVPTNGASFLIGRSVRAIRDDGRFDCLVTYADGWQEHTGAIYRATNWEYCGETKPEAVWVNSSGRMVARKAGPKTRTKAEMEDLGYNCIGRFPKHKYRMVLR